MEAALKSVLAWWDESGVDVPKIAPVKAGGRRAAARASDTGQAAYKPPPPQSSAAKRAPRPASQTAPQTASQTAQQTPPEAAPLALIAEAEKLASRAKTLTELQSYIEGFNAGALSDRARRAVFARGNPAASVMVIGEAPGEAEDAAGKPFTGQAGALLDKMLASIGLAEDNVYITNVVNWRLPGHRRPTEPEIAICQPLIRRHIMLAEPQIILLLGGSAMRALTNYKGITKYRGEWAQITPESAAPDAVKGGAKARAEIPALMSYHPAYLLRQPHLKRDVWRDLLALRAKAAELG